MTRSALVGLCLISLSAPGALAAVPASVAVQGRLTDAGGAPLPAGSKAFTFRIFDAATLGTQIWPAAGGEAQSITTSTDGLWVGAVGTVVPLTEIVFANSALWLEITVDGTTLPRVRLTTGPYAFRVGSVDGASGGTVTGRIVAAGAQEGVRVQGPGVGEANAAWVQFNDAAGTAVGFVGDADVNNPDVYLGSYLGDVHLYTPVGDALRADPNGRVWIGPPPFYLGYSRLNVGRQPGDIYAMAIDGYGQHGLAVSTGGGGSPADAIVASTTTGNNAGVFYGDVSVDGTLTKDAGAFKIDHPLDPANRYLSHSFVESPDMMNIYNGNVSLDDRGEAVVTLPDWFGALNKDFRYQLTPLGQPGPDLHIAQEVTANQFRIAGGSVGMKVSWQVTGIRQDAYANAHRIPVEELKPHTERGFYQFPELYGQPEDKRVALSRHPGLLQQLKKSKLEDRD